MKTRSDNREHYYHAILFCFPIILMALLVIGAFVNNVLRGGGAWNILYSAALVIVIVGGVNIVRGKWPKYRTGEFLSFGVAGLPECEKRIYQRGWRQVRGGALFALLLITLLLGFRG